MRSLLMAILCLIPSVASSQVVEVVGDENYPPVISMVEGAPSGVLVDALRFASQQTGIKIELKLYPWKRAYEHAMVKNVGIIGLSRTKDRELVFDYSEPVYDDNINVIVLKGHEFRFTSVADLRGKRIGVQLGASYGEKVDVALKADGITTESDTSQSLRLLKLLSGRLDCAFVGNGVAGLRSTINSEGELIANSAKFTLLPTPLAHDPLYLAFPKSAQMKGFLELFNKAIARWKVASR